MRLRGALQLVFASLLWYCIRAQDNTTCTADSCGISSCDPGYELEVTVSSDSLLISCEPCDEDYYKSDEGAESCSPCGDGLVAEVGSAVCSLEEGYWRTSNTSTVVYECPNSDACIGGTDQASYCEEGFEGRLCAVCADDYYHSGSYECLPCTAADVAGTTIVVIIFLVCVGLFLLFVTKAADSVVENTDGAAVDDNAHDAAGAALVLAGGGKSGGLIGFMKKWKDTLVVRLKIVVAHFQVVTALPKVLDVQWPQTFDRYADKMSVFNLDIWGLMTQGCYFSADFLYQLVFTTLLPLFIVVVLFAFYCKGFRSRAGRGSQERQRLWDRAAGGILLTAFFFYIITSTVVLKAFECYSFDDGERYLKADLSINCDSRRYDTIFWYAVVMAAVFPVGIPVTYLMVLLIGRKRINPYPDDPEISAQQREEDPSIQKTKFLWSTYRPSIYFYEVWECVRKLLLTGLLVYFEDGTSTQVVISIVITLFGLRVLSGLRPYLREDENSLAEASLWITFLTLFVGLLIKSDVAEEDGYDTAALGALLSVINLALLVLAAFQIMWTTSAWFQATLCGCFSSEGGRDRKRREPKQPRTMRPEPNGQPRRGRSMTSAPTDAASHFVAILTATDRSTREFRTDTATNGQAPPPHHGRREPHPTQAPSSGSQAAETRTDSSRRRSQRDKIHPSHLPEWGEDPRPSGRPIRLEQPARPANTTARGGVMTALVPPQSVAPVQPKHGGISGSGGPGGNVKKEGPSRPEASITRPSRTDERMGISPKENLPRPGPSHQAQSKPDQRKTEASRSKVSIQAIQAPLRSGVATTESSKPRPVDATVSGMGIGDGEPRTRPVDGIPPPRPRSLPSRLSSAMTG